MSKPRICFFDVETSKMLARIFSLRADYVHHSNIVKDWYIICAAWKIGNKVDAVAMNKVGDDKNVCKTLRNVLAGVDVIIGHNSDRFDIKKLNTRLIYHGIDPLPKIPTVDTLKEVRKIAAFTSNRLDYLHKFLGGKGKMSTPSGLWDQVMDGDKQALKDMVAYNKNDVVILEDVYKRLLPYMKSHPNIAMPNTENCPKCGSDHTVKAKPRITASGIRYQQHQCKNCGGYFQSGSPIEKPLSKV